MLKELHDMLLAVQPEGASHDEAACPVCTSSETASAHTPVQGGSVSDEEIKPLRDRNAELEARIAEVEAVQQTSEIDAKAAEIQAAADAEIAELKLQLDAAVLEAQAIKTERDGIVAWLEAQASAAEQAAEMALVREERIAKVAEVAEFPAEYVEANAERWASLSDEAFVALLADYAAIAAKAPGKKEEALELPSATAMHASRQSTETVSPLNEVASLRFKGVDVRTVF